MGVMNLRYKIYYDFVEKKNNSYDIDCLSIVFYMYWDFCLPDGIYKNNFLGLRFWRLIINSPSGIKINY